MCFPRRTQIGRNLHTHFQAPIPDAQNLVFNTFLPAYSILVLNSIIYNKSQSDGPIILGTLPNGPHNYLNWELKGCSQNFRSLALTDWE